LAVLYGRKSAASGQWCTILGYMDRIRAGRVGCLAVMYYWVGRVRAGGRGTWRWGAWAGSEQVSGLVHVGRVRAGS
jgi:hypothetical protein